MKYWKSKEVSLKDAAEWARMGITSTNHMAMEDTPITVTQWGEWKDTTHITEAADWIRLGFNKEKAQIWKEYQVLPMQAKILKEWIHSKFQPAHMRQWMELAIEIPLSTTLANTRISPEQVMEFLDVGYTIEKALLLLFKGILLDKAPSPKRKRENMLYSKKIKKGIHLGLTDRGNVPFKEFLQEHISQGNPFK
ncbi:hypothetical protein DSO57_1029628 [Entomophthora muscae]|uniref:Uncharacterized protein n=1 Tax=Entomophthora muscae TaxID=34485 RepID=A0ACC2UA49_9FUNG|nr:hypothetical protein DSO57_1029628 [Entomophthora muscae]